MGTVELDVLINDYVPGSCPLDQKRAQVTLQFLNSFDDSLLISGSVSRTFQLSAKSSSPSVPTTTAARNSHKRPREDSTSTSPGSKRLPGFSILTKDGVDITEYASRGPKTKEQRDHAALMRKLKACDKCKRSKQRCDPSHHSVVVSPASPSSVTTPSSSISTAPSFSNPSFSRRSGSSSGRTSISPQSAVESSFDYPAGNFLYPEIPQVDKVALARIEARRQELLQQQAELDAELAALTDQHFLGAPMEHQYSSQSSGAASQSFNAGSPFTSSSFFDDKWMDSFDFSSEVFNQPLLPFVIDSPSQLFTSTESQAVSPADTNASGALASSSRRRLPSPVFEGDNDQFFNDTTSTNGTSGNGLDALECHGDAPFDHNHRQHLLQDFVLFPKGSYTQYSLESSRGLRTVQSGRPESLVLQDLGSQTTMEHASSMDDVLAPHISGRNNSNDMYGGILVSASDTIEVLRSQGIDNLETTPQNRQGITTTTSGNFQSQMTGGSPLVWDEKSHKVALKHRQRSSVSHASSPKTCGICASSNASTMNAALSTSANGSILTHTQSRAQSLALLVDRRSVNSHSIPDVIIHRDHAASSTNDAIDTAVSRNKSNEPCRVGTARNTTTRLAQANGNTLAIAATKLPPKASELFASSGHISSPLRSSQSSVVSSSDPNNPTCIDMLGLRISNSVRSCSTISAIAMRMIALAGAVLVTAGLAAIEHQTTSHMARQLAFVTVSTPRRYQNVVISNMSSIRFYPSLSHRSPQFYVLLSPRYLVNQRGSSRASTKQSSRIFRLRRVCHHKTIMRLRSLPLVPREMSPLLIACAETYRLIYPAHACLRQSWPWPRHFAA